MVSLLPEKLPLFIPDVRIRVLFTNTITYSLFSDHLCVRFPVTANLPSLPPRATQKLTPNVQSVTTFSKHY